MRTQADEKNTLRLMHETWKNIYTTSPPRLLVLRVRCLTTMSPITSRTRIVRYEHARYRYGHVCSSCKLRVSKFHYFQQHLEWLHLRHASCRYPCRFQEMDLTVIRKFVNGHHASDIRKLQLGNFSEYHQRTKVTNYFLMCLQFINGIHIL